MTLKEYLSLIADEEARIELELDIETEGDYSYKSFWLSDFRVGCLSEYSEWTVECVSFVSQMDDSAELSIQIKP